MFQDSLITCKARPTRDKIVHEGCESRVAIKICILHFAVALFSLNVSTIDKGVGVWSMV